MTHPLAPDFEDRQRLTLELLEHLNLDPAQVEHGTLTVELGDDQRHTIRWHGIAKITTDQLAQLAALADAKADAR